MLRTNRTNCAKSCLDMFEGAIISEIWYHEQVLIIEDLRILRFKCTPVPKERIPAVRHYDTVSPEQGYHIFATCEFTRLMPDPTRILHAWICNSPGPLG